MAGALAGLYAPASARVQPAALAAGIAAAAERRGVQIYEATPVSAIEPASVADSGSGSGSGGAGAIARTKFGDVRARSVLRCTEGYTGALPGLRRALLPMNSHLIVTEPLSAASTHPPAPGFSPLPWRPAWPPRPNAAASRSTKRRRSR